MSKKRFRTPNVVIEPYQYDMALEYIEAYRPSTEINNLIEIYLILKLLKTENEFSRFKHLIRKFHNDLSANFPITIFEIDYDSIYIFYKDVFWELVLSLERINKDDVSQFESYIKKYNIQTMNFKNVTKLIDLFPQVIKENFLSLSRNIEFFLNHQSGKFTDSNGLYIKLGITNEEINNLAIEYCQTDSINPNYLQSIVEYKKLSKYEFDDEVKLLAKRKSEEFWEKHFETNEGIHYSISVGIKPLDSDKLFEPIENGILLNKIILDEHHDFPTLLNNYIYLLNFFNLESGLPWLVANEEVFSLTSIFYPKSNAHFGTFNNILKRYHSLLFQAYFDYLKQNEIDVEEIIEWYFNIYLETELDIKGFHFHASNKESSYYERGKSIICEMDSILDQYELFVRHGEINQDLLEIKSKASSYASLKSFNKKKFLKLSNNPDNSALFSVLFSDQSSLSFNSSKKEHGTFFKHIIDGVKITDFADYQVEQIKILIEKNILKLSDDVIKFTNFQEINILNKLWKSGTYCLYYKDKLILDIAEDLCKKGYCEYSDNIFSEYESNYLSYILDDKKYGNGLKIRNKFSHGKFGYKKEEEHLQNYLELLQIVIFYVMRINDELEYYTTLKHSYK
jgi:putative orphan protein